jgi:DNA-directed RNA polymerase subunit N (RpoN/RPB10)
MPSKRHLILADRWERLRKLADGTRTRQQLADELGVTFTCLTKMVLRDPSLNIARAVRKDAGEGRRVRNGRRGGCINALREGDSGKTCGTCAACEAFDAKVPAVPRCKCGLALPCNLCVGTIQDYMYTDGGVSLRRGNGMSGTGIH